MSRWLCGQLLFGVSIILFMTAIPHDLLSEARIVELRKIWDQAPHNAFTDLHRFQGRWFLVFREGKNHVSPDGAIRLLESQDGAQWESAALLRYEKGDLRDPKISVTPDGRLMITTAAALHPDAPHKHQSIVYFSRNGRDWDTPIEVCDSDFWLWRVTWHRGSAYGIGYNTTIGSGARLYRSLDGHRWESWVGNLFEPGFPNETSILFLPDDTALVLLRRDKVSMTAQLGKSKPPYTQWTWQDLGVRIGGPHMIVLPDGRIVAGVRLYDGRVRTSLAWIERDRGRLAEFLVLPSGGDTSYAGLIWHEGLLWVSYYSSHEGKASIYIAKIQLALNR